MQERASRLREEIMVVNKATKQRNNIVDMAKGLGNHTHDFRSCINERQGHYIFHMPVFFVMAGFFLKTDNMKLLVKKKVRSLLGVYVSLGILTIFIGLVRLLLFYDYSLADAAFVSFNRLRGLVTCRDVWLLWFFVVLFESEIIYACIYRLFSQRIVLRWLIIILLNISGYIISCIYQEVWCRRVLVVFGENTILIVAVQNICRQFMPWKNMTISLGTQVCLRYR